MADREYREYRVRWEIDIAAFTPQQAAQKARMIQRDPFSIATFYDVKADGKRSWTKVELPITMIEGAAEQKHRAMTAAKTALNLMLDRLHESDDLRPDCINALYLINKALGEEEVEEVAK